MIGRIVESLEIDQPGFPPREPGFFCRYPECWPGFKISGSFPLKVPLG